MKLHSTYFCGNEASEYAKENGYLDYFTLSKAFNHVIYNDIYSLSEDFEPYCGFDEDEDGNCPEVYQWFIIDEHGVEILEEAGEILFYSDRLDMYVWGVTHFGTSWDYVLTNIKLNEPWE